MPDLEELWYDLNRQSVHAFADWPNREIPKGKPGVYLIYQGVRLIYVGKAKKNLLGRLTQHARGHRSGDQFCVYLGDRLVMPKLGIDQMKDLFSGELSLDHEIKKFVRSQLSYRYLIVKDDPTARTLEAHGLQVAKGQGAELLNAN
ncbi:MAG: GIY-YIG nuclease family protein [Verrucomicrobia bacterium]|nr:GIY-YIG nuclease family protein [Verrucomicrobiota bacterium]MDA1045940.1 GIY-YIG nuclease family protein [Verrucomicrobiota bacterium]